jgi:hypothetical protein
VFLVLETSFPLSNHLISLCNVAIALSNILIEVGNHFVTLDNQRFDFVTLLDQLLAFGLSC